MKKKCEGFPIGISIMSRHRMGDCCDRVARCVRPFGHTFVIALPAALISSERKRRKNLKNRGETTTSERKRRKNLKKKRGKTPTIFLELLKQQEALFKSLSNNQPTDSTTIFTQNAMWNALETFSYTPDEDKTFEAY